MASEVDVSLPHVRQLQAFIRDQQSLEIQLVTGEHLTGKLRWQDPECLCIDDGSSQPTLLWRHAIAYVKPQA